MIIQSVPTHDGAPTTEERQQLVSDINTFFATEQPGYQDGLDLLSLCQALWYLMQHPQ